jgi:two-component system cell cycle sensor histidine kinase/response regulator CckA
MPAPAPSRPTPYRFLAVAIVLAGLVAAVIWYRRGWEEQSRQAEAELARRAFLQHALAREILHSYEDALVALTSLFLREGPVTRQEFVHATSRIRERLAGAQAVEWAPLVMAGERRAVEAAGREAYAPLGFNFVDFDPRGQPHRAESRPFYYPVVHVEPLDGNEVALGYDLAGGSRRPFLDQARATQRLVVTRPLSLVQDQNGAAAVIMIVPVSRPARGATPAADTFVGFVLGVFRVREILASLDGGQADPVLDVLVVDREEKDPAQRSLFVRMEHPAGAGSPLPTDTEFRQGGPVVEHPLTFGGLSWHILYRPRTAWLAEQHTFYPALRSGSVVLLTALMAGLVWVLGRRTETIRHEVAERTSELAESRRQLSELLHALPGMAFRLNMGEELTLAFVSEGTRELTGWSVEDVLAGRHHFRELIHPDDLARVREATRRALQDRTDLEIEYRLRTRTGGEKWVLCRGRGIYREDGGVTSFEGLAIDVSAQKKAEHARLELERKLLEGQKLESLGLLAGGIAHDFNNLLSAILGNANILRVGGTLTGAATNQVTAIETASLRAAELCRQMLAYAGKGRLVVEPLDITALIHELLPCWRFPSCGRRRSSETSSPISRR